MTGQQIKNSILQLAIQGKLVPQDPNDEPASVLLEKIRKEKVQMVKDGKLKKKDLETTPISDDEKPFEIPESWEWCRLSSLVSVLGDGIHGTPQYDSFGEYYFVNGNNLNNGVITIKPETKRCNAIEFEKYKKPLNDHSMLVSINGTIGNYAFYNEEPIFLGKSACYFNLIIDEFKEYMKYLIQTKYFLDYALESATGTTIKNVSLKAMKEFLIPLPPLAEQKRIVAKIEELLPLVEEYDKAQKELEALNTSLPEALKKSILQEAIQGKLVPQDPNDEPASVLLEKIRKEKVQMVKDGKLKKKDLETTPISDDEKPFEIPESWEWCRLGDICVKLVDGDHNPPAGLNTTSPYLMLSSRNINDDTIVDLDNVRYLSKEVFEKENERTKLEVGDILFTSVGTLGRSCIVKDYNYFTFQRSVSVITTLAYNEYIKRTLDAPCSQYFIEEKATGTAQRGFYLNQLERILIPLPPLAEQHRIVAKIEELFKAIDNLKVS